MLCYCFCSVAFVLFLLIWDFPKGKGGIYNGENSKISGELLGEF